MKRLIILATLSGLLQAGLAQISVIGTATPAGDWDTDYDMVQDAGIPSLFRLNIYLAEGHVKFREGHAWTTSWGDDDFPAGVAVLGGANIPVTPGFYTITFDTTTLAYLFSSGNVGVNNQDPAVSLDISGALAHRVAHLDVSSMAANLPANVTLLKLTGSPAGPVVLSGSGGADGQRLILYNATFTEQPVMVFDGAFTIGPGETREFTFVAGEGWKPLSSGEAANNNFWVQDGANDAIRNDNPDGFYSAHNTTVIIDPGAVPLAVEGEGTRLMWIPDKSAFRAGTVQGMQWDMDSIGAWSFASGFNVSATGVMATAFGNSAKASGSSSLALGWNTRAQGVGSTALNLATRAEGWGTTALGYGTTAKAYGSLALGTYNDTIAGSDPDTWVATDPLLLVGNGSSSSSLSNAMTVLKNGNIGIGNDNPAVSMDITGALAHRKVDLDVTSMEVDLPLNVSLVKLTGSPPGPVVLSGPGAADGQRVVLLNATTTSQPVTAFDAPNVIGPGETREFAFVTGEGWKPLSAGPAANNNFWVQDGANDAIRNDNPDGFYSAHNTTVIIDPGAVPLAVEGEGTRLMWIPDKSAFRAGTVQGMQWDADSIGAWSFASGFNVSATGVMATAFGNSAKASGSSSLALGWNTRAQGVGSTALNLATRAEGWGTTALGYGTTAKAYGSLALGTYNDTIAGSDPDTWVATDPLLLVGNGTGSSDLSNALTVLKNGNVGIGNAPSAKAPTARLVVDGYTRLGTTPENAPAIKMKKLTGTGPVTDGTKPIAHDLDAAKILSVSVLMEYGLGPGETIPPEYTTSAGYEFEYQVRTNDIFLLNKPGNSANIDERPVRILITYEE